MFKFELLDSELNKTTRDDIVKEEVCVICYSDEPSVLFLPCNHQACCKVWSMGARRTPI